MNSPMAQTLSQNQTKLCMDMSFTTEIMVIFVIFGQNLVAMATSFRPLQSEMSSLDWSTTKTPCYEQSHSRYLL